MRKSILYFIAITTLFINFISCSDDEPDTAQVAVRLVDAPGDYDKVNIEVTDVMVNRNDEWQSIGNVTPQVYDLLELTGGIDALLVDSEIPSGRINQIRLVLGQNNTIVVDGVSYPLKTPSAQQSGLKLNVQQDLVGGVKYTFILDFVVDKSIVENGNGDYSLKPTIKVSTEAVSGAISGMISPIDYQVEVKATTATDTISAYANTDGKFKLYGVPEGTYKVTFTPEISSNLSLKIEDNVEVVIGQNTDMGTVTLE
jgi:hypothetical protein